MRCAAGRESDELMAQARADTRVAAGAPGVPSVVIPAHNEADNLESTVAGLIAALKAAQITHEILIVDDNSTDNSRALLAELSARYPKLLSIDNAPPNGFGFAVRAGLDTLRRNAVAIVMADGSDTPPTLCHAIRSSPKGTTAYSVRGSSRRQSNRLPDPQARLQSAGQSVHPRSVLPSLQRFHQRLQALSPRGDRWPAAAAVASFQLDRRTAAQGADPRLQLSRHPISWQNGKAGIPKLNIREMGSRYPFIVLYCLIEQRLSRGGYRAASAEPTAVSSLQIRSNLCLPRRGKTL